MLASSKHRPYFSHLTENMKKVIDRDKGAGCAKMLTEFLVLVWQTTPLCSVYGIKNNDFYSNFWKKNKKNCNILKT